MFKTKGEISCYESVDEASVVVYINDYDQFKDFKYEIRKLIRHSDQKQENKFFTKYEFLPMYTSRGKFIMSGVKVFEDECYKNGTERLKEFWELCTDISDAFRENAVAQLMSEESSLHICINCTECSAYDMIEVTYSSNDEVIVSFPVERIMPIPDSRKYAAKLRPL